MIPIGELSEYAKSGSSAAVKGIEIDITITGVQLIGGWKRFLASGWTLKMASGWKLHPRLEKPQALCEAYAKSIKRGHK